MTSFTAILGAVHEQCGVDFSTYRTATVERRILNRMTSLGVSDLAAYRRLLDGSADEAHQLIERITIKVSRLYRNRDVFDALRAELPALAPAAGAPLRIWSAGCGRGEEPYTLSMLLEEAGVAGTVTATDIDPVALAGARAGVYPASAATELPADLRERFLRPVRLASGDHLSVCEALKARVSFARGDLGSAATPAPAAYDLICCRNVLIYWSAERQEQILATLLANLRVGGLLCLGEAEWPAATMAERLQARGKLRIFRHLAGRESA